MEMSTYFGDVKTREQRLASIKPEVLSKEKLESWFIPKVKVKEKEEEIVEDESVCEFCGGTGEISSMEQVYAGEPHMADIGTRPCICRVGDIDDYNPDREV